MEKFILTFVVLFLVSCGNPSTTQVEETATPVPPTATPEPPTESPTLLMPTETATYTLVPPTTTSMDLLKPYPGIWEGSGTILTDEGAERGLFVFFTVSEDGLRLESAATIYIEGHELVKGEQYNANIIGGPIQIKDNSLSMSHTQGNINNLIHVEIIGKFVSPTLLEGTFESFEGKGIWTATPMDE